MKIYGGFLKWGYPQIIYFTVHSRFFSINHPAIGVAHCRKPPYENDCLKQFQLKRYVFLEDCATVIPGSWPVNHPSRRLSIHRGFLYPQCSGRTIHSHAIWPWHIWTADWFKWNLRRNPQHVMGKHCRFHLSDQSLKSIHVDQSSRMVPSQLCCSLPFWLDSKVTRWTPQNQKPLGIDILLLLIMNNKDIKHGKWWYII